MLVSLEGIADLWIALVSSIIPKLVNYDVYVRMLFADVVKLKIFHTDWF